MRRAIRPALLAASLRNLLRKRPQGFCLCIPESRGSRSPRTTFTPALHLDSLTSGSAFDFRSTCVPSRRRAKQVRLTEPQHFSIWWWTMRASPHQATAFSLPGPGLTRKEVSLPHLSNYSVSSHRFPQAFWHHPPTPKAAPQPTQRLPQSRVVLLSSCTGGVYVDDDW